jgi:propanol-preferring alcohol dehydrogenase
MRLAGELKLEIEVTRYPIKDANEALDDLRAGRLTGAAVLVMLDESHG